MEWQQRTSLTHIWGCRGDSNQYKITLQGINLATRHTWATKTTRVTTFHEDYQRVELGPPYPSAIFHMKTSTGSPWVAETLSQCHPWSTMGVSSNSGIIEATKFAGPHESCMCQYIINLVHRGQTIGPQSTLAGATTFGAPNIKTDHSQLFCPVFSTFP
jgi:hypothetical protein